MLQKITRRIQAMEEYYSERLIIFRKLIYSRMAEQLANTGEVKD